MKDTMNADASDQRIRSDTVAKGLLRCWTLITLKIIGLFARCLLLHGLNTTALLAALRFNFVINFVQTMYKYRSLYDRRHHRGKHAALDLSYKQSDPDTHKR
jgi:hypothetical protein